MSLPQLDKEIPREERIYYYRQAGKTTYEIFEEVKALVKPGVKIIDICSKTRELIFDKGAKPSFPCVVAINNIATHFTSPFEDETVIPQNSVVKLDIGCHINGFIANKAETICFNDEYKSLVEAVEKAWENAMEIVRVGTETSMIGVAVEDTIREYGYLPIKDLTGNQLDRYQLHGDKVLPNVRMPYSKADSVMEVDEAYAFDTFATTGSGSVHQDQTKIYINMLRPTRVPLRSKASREIRNHIFKEYFTLPFAERWLMEVPEFHPARVRLTLRELKRSNGVIEFPVLSDTKESFISQYKNTFYVTDEGYVVLTQPPFDFQKPESIKAAEETIENNTEMIVEKEEKDLNSDQE
ncbi:MAG: type II methionyl aminopeptidase [Candidatus Hodarchaeales archaeon]|jgi:methionyl aminopeptidase